VGKVKISYIYHNRNFSYPKLLLFSILTFIKWRLNTELLANTLRNVVFFFNLKKLTIVTGSWLIMHWPERGQIYFYASSPDAAAWMLKFLFVYLSNMAVLCYSLTIICCCQVQDYIYWIISTENDHRHHHKFIKYEKQLRKEGKNMLGLPIKQNLCHFSTSLDA
jgi:hypothetical protein